MDVAVTPDEADTWRLDDERHRHLGIIMRYAAGQFMIYREPGALIGVEAGPYPSLEAAMSEIASRVDGKCLLTSGM